MSTATIHRSKSANGKPSFSKVPTLLNGDHLTVPEFERRYEAMPGDRKAELIEGMVIMSPPTSDTHGEAQTQLTQHLLRYSLATPGVAFRSNTSVRLDGRNEYQPDIFLRIERGKLARTKIAPDGLIEGGPEFVAEIAVSSAAYDLHEKKSVYQRSLVPEYFVWQVMDSQIHWFALEQGKYVKLKPQSDGAMHSQIFPGLWLATRALLDGDEVKVSRTLEKGFKSAEHAAFVKKLASAK